MSSLTYFEAFAKSKRSTEAFTEPALSDSELQQLEDIRNQVPLLESLRNGSDLPSRHGGRLVQLRGLVVETLDPEIYPGVVQEEDGNWSCGKYGNEIPCLTANTAKNLSYWERQPVAVKPIPGLSTWCNTCLTSGATVDTVSDTLARSTGLGQSSQQSLVDTAFPQQASENAIVLLHDEAARSARLHDIIDVIGILDSVVHEDDAHMGAQEDFDELMEEEGVIDEAADVENMGTHENSGMQARRQPKVSPSQLRVHSMRVQRLRNLDCSPFDLVLVKRTLASDFMASMRVAAIHWLAACCGGDELLGELLLLQLLCKSAKVTNGAVTRRMTMNICGFPTATSKKGSLDSSKVSAAAASHSFGNAAVHMPSPGSGLPPGTTSTAALNIAEAISAIYPLVQIIPTTDQTMGCQQLMPNHNAVSNRLHTGLMQQAPHSCLVVDECISSLSAPSQEHDAPRSRNMMAVQEYMKHGVITANYMWQQVRLPVSGSVLVVSDEPCTFLESCRICISASNAPQASAVPVDASHPLQGIRSYLACAWDLWDRLEYEGQESGNAGNHPRWVIETLVAQGKQVAAAVNSSSGAAGDTTRAFETAVMLLHCLCVSQGKAQISRSDWRAVERVMASCRARSGPLSDGPTLKACDQPVAASPHGMHAQHMDQDMDSGEQVLRQRQPAQG